MQESCWISNCSLKMLTNFSIVLIVQIKVNQIILFLIKSSLLLRARNKRKVFIGLNLSIALKVVEQFAGQRTAWQHLLFQQRGTMTELTQKGKGRCRSPLFLIQPCQLKMFLRAVHVTDGRDRTSCVLWQK